jgi:molybdate transport system ATP-binding protein
LVELASVSNEGRVAGAEFLVPLMQASVGSSCRSCIPAREVVLAAQPPHLVNLHNVIPGAVRRTAADESRNTVMVGVGLSDGALLSRVTPDAVERLSLAPGAPILG